MDRRKHITSNGAGTKPRWVRTLTALLLVFVTLFSAGCTGKTGSTDQKKLVTQVNEYLAEIKADGTLKEIEDRWYSDEGDSTDLDFSSLTGENGTLRFATATTKPFSFEKNGSFAGIVPDIVYGFCREYGYKVEIKNYNDTNSLVLAVSQGKCDFGAENISITEERKKSVVFSDPYYTNRGVIVMNEADSAEYKDFSSLEGKKIGVLTGNVYHDEVSERIKDAEVLEYNAVPDMCQALSAGKVDAIADDECILRYAMLNFPGEKTVDVLLDDDFYGFVFPKGTDDAGNKPAEKKSVLSQMNEYIADIKADGTLKDIEDRWYADKGGKLDFSSLTGENGTLIFGTKTTKPFSYLSGDDHAGITIEIVLGFCRKYGYKVEFSDFSDTNSLVLAVSQGKCDFGGANISITDERKKAVDFTDPYYLNAGAVAMNEANAASYKDLSSLDGKKLGVITGTVYHDIISKKINNAEVLEYNAVADLCQALESGKVDAIVHDECVLRYATLNYPKQKTVGTLVEDDTFGFVFPKDAVRNTDTADETDTEDNSSPIITSIRRTLIDEDRWKQILTGIGTTLLITVLSIIIGTAAGFGLCMAQRENVRFVNRLIGAFSWLVRGLPTVVLLLIMYYVVFGSVSIGGTAVSVVSFSIVFAVTVCGLLGSGIAAVDRGQFEACVALGYTERSGFMKLILPQVVRFALPGFRTEVIALIKATSIVGYIAVQDLTKAGDIIRSSTYEAFTPLILTAVIYFVLAWILTRVVDLIGKAIERASSLDRFMKGVDRNA